MLTVPANIYSLPVRAGSLQCLYGQISSLANTSGDPRNTQNQAVSFPGETALVGCFSLPFHQSVLQCEEQFIHDVGPGPVMGKEML